MVESAGKAGAKTEGKVQFKELMDTLGVEQDQEVLKQLVDSKCLALECAG